MHYLASGHGPHLHFLAFQQAFFFTTDSYTDCLFSEIVSLKYQLTCELQIIWQERGGERAADSQPAFLLELLLFSQTIKGFLRSFKERIRAQSS